MGTKNIDEPKPPSVPRISAKNARKMKINKFSELNFEIIYLVHQENQSKIILKIIMN